ncbi:MAG: dockerin type I repeat-containing protein [Clostridia bacterium]|nr:dockerin type I repeat-containing protein [Clostridia bacterium]
MKKLLSLFLAACFVLSSFVLFASAEEEEYEAIDGVPMMKGEILVYTHEKLDVSEYEGEAAIDFLGVPIIRLAVIGLDEYIFYHIKCSPEIETQEALKILGENELVKETIINYISGLGLPPERYLPKESYFIGKTAEELMNDAVCYSAKVTVYAECELTLTENEKTGSKYLYGVPVESLERIENLEGYVYRVVLLKDNDFGYDFWAKVLRDHANVTEVATKSLYGCGDIDLNGITDQYDYILVKRMHFETYRATSEELGYADVNMDGFVDVYDYLLIARHYFGTYVIK